MKYAISRTILDRLCNEAKTAGNREVCGLLVGRDQTILDAIAIANVAATGDEFLLDPAGHIEASRQARHKELKVLGCYHSHPSGVLSPSAADARHAAEQGFLWLIIGGGGASLWISCAGGAVQGAFEMAQFEIV